MFEPRNSFEHIDELTYEIGPRLAGTRRAEESSDYINQEFEDYGLSTEIQNFDFVDRVSKIRFMVLILAAVFLVTPILNPVIGVFFVAGGYAVAYPLPRFFPRRTDRNVIGKFKPESEVNKRIVIGAHYDSAKCVRRWNWVYVFKFALPAVMGLFFAISIFRFFMGSTAWLITWVCVAVPYLLTCAIPFFTYESKVSPGANDNASGISVLLELARVISELKPENTEIYFVAFGAEEQGLVGSKNFVKENKEFDFFLNLDSVGSGEELALIKGNGTFCQNITSPELNNMVGGEMGLEKIWAPFSVHDHLPFIEENIPSTTLTSIDSKEKTDLDNYMEKLFSLSDIRTSPHRKLHSPEDIPERISLENIEKSGNLILDAIGVGKE